ncbi:DUF4214 domain-containing protein [Azotobacter chroococcum]|uniref:DUF4214 domain-containing protein n=1 Tax=Azotobacter chroococcum TaxID=353 RepID=A0AAQ0C168_9GAMM|nr:DUF4214 domain-containing protein [Azotobacter chroococcum]QQE90056.1 DUF4214 domain-containing protein [Azotobacter chroococcum]
MSFNYELPLPVEGLQDLLENILPGDLISIIGDLIPSLPDGVDSFNVAQAGLNGNTLALMGNEVNADADVVLTQVAGEAGQQQAVVIPSEILENAKLYAFDSQADLSIGFNTVERTIISGNGNDLITVSGDKNTTLVGATGNDTLITSGGNDSVVGGLGNDSISTGAGNDTIVSGLGHDTINAGEGFDVVKFNGNVEDFNIIDLGDGELFVHSKLSPLNSSTIRNTEILSFETPAGTDNVALVENETEATAMRLYEAFFDRSADIDGAEYWLGQLEAGAVSLTDIANGFQNSEEFQANGELDDSAFVELLYENALDREADEAGKDFWVEQLEGGVSRADVAISIVGSSEAAETIDNVIIISGDQV